MVGISSGTGSLSWKDAMTTMNTRPQFSPVDSLLGTQNSAAFLELSELTNKLHQAGWHWARMCHPEAGAFAPVGMSLQDAKVAFAKVTGVNPDAVTAAGQAKFLFLA